VARPAGDATQLAVVGERPYVLGIAPTRAGTVVVGRSFDALEGAIASLPSRPALVAVADDRALGSPPPDAPKAGWNDVLRTRASAGAGARRAGRALGAPRGGVFCPCCPGESPGGRRGVSGSGGPHRSPPRGRARWASRRSPRPSAAGARRSAAGPARDRRRRA